ncbi:aminodeoxychorismate/anthranilate synthase component II [Helicobacter jaachi]|uniref:Aminodeoxychorismate/anthranilate synthase component II n=1 Tax=Helicobacter jaachi TaxID=1677920 RepID=A0A4U8TD31_9HELI|nr:aminodeoxychorismate/anthranilate synthase component II [Helicobacter jaachi]TLD97564.1 aminodeoxychorismate/anthranilate synthase component II [Helicobacter jaachi]
MGQKCAFRAKVLVIDNYDSFTYNIIYLLQNLGLQPIVLTNDVDLATLQQHTFSHLIISPGPSHPLDSGVCLEAIRYFAPSKKILGICLGHQCIAQAFGGEVIPLENPIHAKSGRLFFSPNPLFKGVKQGVKIALYHSLYVSKLGACEPLGYSEANVLMALKARAFDTYGVQFHPESILQAQGKIIMRNFLRL